jgi:hypothetical protein
VSSSSFEAGTTLNLKFGSESMEEEPWGSFFSLKGMLDLQISASQEGEYMKYLKEVYADVARNLKRKHDEKREPEELQRRNGGVGDSGLMMGKSDAKKMQGERNVGRKRVKFAKEGDKGAGRGVTVGKVGGLNCGNGSGAVKSKGKGKEKESNEGAAAKVPKDVDAMDVDDDKLKTSKATISDGSQGLAGNKEGSKCNNTKNLDLGADSNKTLTANQQQQQNKLKQTTSNGDTQDGDHDDASSKTRKRNRKRKRTRPGKSKGATEGENDAMEVAEKGQGSDKVMVKSTTEAGEEDKEGNDVDMMNVDDGMNGGEQRDAANNCNTTLNIADGSNRADVQSFAAVDNTTSVPDYVKENHGKPPPIPKVGHNDLATKQRKRKLIAPESSDDDEENVAQTQPRRKPQKEACVGNIIPKSSTLLKTPLDNPDATKKPKSKSNPTFLSRIPSHLKTVPNMETLLWQIRQHMIMISQQGTQTGINALPIASTTMGRCDDTLLRPVGLGWGAYLPLKGFFGAKDDVNKMTGKTSIGIGEREWKMMEMEVWLRQLYKVGYEDDRSGGSTRNDDDAQVEDEMMDMDTQAIDNGESGSLNNKASSVRMVVEALWKYVKGEQFGAENVDGNGEWWTPTNAVAISQTLLYGGNDYPEDSIAPASGQLHQHDVFSSARGIDVQQKASNSVGYKPANGEPLSRALSSILKTRRLAKISKVETMLQRYLNMLEPLRVELWLSVSEMRKLEAVGVGIFQEAAKGKYKSDQDDDDDEDERYMKMLAEDWRVWKCRFGEGDGYLEFGVFDGSVGYSQPGKARPVELMKKSQTRADMNGCKLDEEWERQLGRLMMKLRLLSDLYVMGVRKFLHIT